MRHSLTRPEQQALKRAAPRLLRAWQLTDHESTRLLGLTRDEWLSLKANPSNCCITGELILRIAGLTGVHAALMIIYSGDVSRVARWIIAENSGPIMQGRNPLDAMSQGGLPVINRVRGFLEAEVAG